MSKNKEENECYAFLRGGGVHKIIRHITAGVRGTAGWQ
jgi:hypothetical protein